LRDGYSFEYIIETVLSTSLANIPHCREYSSTHIDVELPRHHRHHREQREFVFERPHHREQREITVERPHHHEQREIVVERPHHHNNHLNSRIDIAEREYRSRFQPTYREEVRIETTVDPPKQEIVNDKMGYYDEDGNYNSDSLS
jgi:hypothetical protein